MANNCNCNLDVTNSNYVTTEMEEFINAKNRAEDQADYAFIQRIIQNVTQSCALNLPIPASAIPPLVLQAAQFFWENDDRAVEERWYCLPNREFRKFGPNAIAQLPEQIVSVFGCYKANDSFNYGALGDFSLERMIINNSMMSSNIGGTLNNVFGPGGGFNITDVTAALYEVSTFKSLFDVPLTYNYNQFSKELVILGSLESSDLILSTWQRCKVQNLYKDYYFFRYCVCLVKQSLATIMGTFEFKLPGGVSMNLNQFSDPAQSEMDKIEEWINKNHAVDYFFNSESI